jgi:hypothetical protein
MVNLQSHILLWPKVFEGLVLSGDHWDISTYGSGTGVSADNIGGYNGNGYGPGVGNGYMRGDCLRNQDPTIYSNKSGDGRGYGYCDYLTNDGIFITDSGNGGSLSEVS